MEKINTGYLLTKPQNYAEKVSTAARVRMVGSLARRERGRGFNCGQSPHGRLTRETRAKLEHEYIYSSAKKIAGQLALLEIDEQ
jgi:hypothetical protein